MRGASAESLANLVDELNPAGGVRATVSRLAQRVAGAVTGDVPPTGVTAGLGSGQADRMSEDLFGVAGVLRREPRLRRTLTDGSLPAAAKAGLARTIFGDALDAHSLSLVASAVGERWTSQRDLADAVEHLGIVAAVKGAEQRDEADALESELFAFERLVADNPHLRDALSDPARSTEDRQELVRDLLEGRATGATVRLAQQAVAGSHRTVTLAVEAYQRIAAEHRDRLVATVRVARDLAEDDGRRLSAALERQYGRPVHLNVLVDPDVIGGLRVEIGNDVIDGSVASRLDEARRRLAG